VASVHETSTGEKVMGRLHAFFSLGALVGGVAVGALREAGWGVEPILVAIALVVGVVGIAQARVRVPIVEAHRRPRVRMTTTLLLLGALCGLAFLIEDGLLSWSAIHLQQNLGAGPFVQGLGPAVLSAAMVAGRVATARLSERYSERVLLLAGGLIGTLGGVWFAHAQSAGDGLVAAALTGAAISVAAPLIFGLAGRIGGSGGQAAAIARVTTVAYTGFVIGPALVGGVAGAAGLRNGLLVLAAASFLLAAGSLMLPATD
jgi:MFS family permease